MQTFSRLSRNLIVSINGVQIRPRLSRQPLLKRAFQPARHLHSFPRATPFPITRYQKRLNSTTPLPSQTETAITDPTRPPTEPPTADTPSYQLTFTCKPCKARSSHRVTKQGYHKGTVLITCPSCHARHLIADHLRVFVDKKSALEDILMQKAAPGTDLRKLLKKGQLGVRQGEMVGREGEESVEFWEDGTESRHQRDQEADADAEK